MHTIKYRQLLYIILHYLAITEKEILPARKDMEPGVRPDESVTVKPFLNKSG